ncbi:hypothetical protein N7493_011744 [Penicillium malachiteum]|uniref:Uncharacterized protein n=1 Tax=Penicillium malachiteum TaxID=1324776 RepID=A0AAD6MQ80_9EURO|nr:hypothetical protein N7493_011744 [Penicillium malachiteum]
MAKRRASSPAANGMKPKKEKKAKPPDNKKRKRNSKNTNGTEKLNGVGIHDGDSNKRMSPWDETERNPVDVNSLNLTETIIYDISEDEEEGPPPKKAKKNPKWEHKGPTPLIDLEQLPDGWTANEPDLDTFDIDGQIDRCHERLEANIMPMVFEQRLKEYQLVKNKQVYNQNLYPDLTPAVIERILNLRTIFNEMDQTPSHNGFQSNGHKVESDDMIAARERKARQQENIKAVLQAYMSGQLQWMEGYVTYWSKGQQLCQPRLFDWDEFEAIYDRVDGNSSFWTEGYKLAVRIPGYKWWMELEFAHDTGASMMTLFRGDIRTLMGPFGPPNEPLLRVGWVTSFVTLAGTVARDIVQVEVTILDANQQRLAPWTRVQASLVDGYYQPGANARLDGPWLRYMMYYANVPDGNSRLYIADTQNNLTNELQDLGLLEIALQQGELLLRLGLHQL